MVIPSIRIIRIRIRTRCRIPARPRRAGRIPDRTRISCRIRIRMGSFTRMA